MSKVNEEAKREVVKGIETIFGMGCDAMGNMLGVPSLVAYHLQELLIGEVEDYGKDAVAEKLVEDYG